MHTSIHKFHIPVMGLSYTIDSPVKVARYGISSVISIVEDRLIEMMRGYYYLRINEPYIPITTKEDNYREKRITDYLNLVNRIVTSQVEKIKTSAFEAGSEIVRYFEMLPDDSKLKHLYRQMTGVHDVAEKEKLQTLLRRQVVAGGIDVNVMTKLDKNNYDKDGAVIDDGSDAVSALRGYANSQLTNSSIIFSAGMNPRLYNYLEKLTAFDLNDKGEFDKKVVIKVSDYRSALIQGKYLAKKGIWVSEFRIESGLNCGGHAFATDGYLLGPIMEEFRTKKAELTNALFDVYKKAVEAKQGTQLSEPHPVKITVQGGVGTNEESELMLQYYGVESVGWGSPFLLVPEATTVDEETLELLCKANEKEVVLSNNSPLGVRFHHLSGTSGDKEKKERIEKGKPGSPCTEKFLVSNTEFTEEPICTASSKYQKLKIEQLKSANLAPKQLERELKNVLDKECLCIGLSNAAAITYKQPFLKNLEAVTICPGPNIAYFSKIVSLDEMTDHIYGRTNILTDTGRPHFFIKELQIYISYLKEQLESEENLANDNKRMKYYNEFNNQLHKGIEYYRSVANVNNGWSAATIEKFELDLNKAANELNEMFEKYTTAVLA